MIKIYIDRQKIAENEPAIVVESGDEVSFCSLVHTPDFAIKQDFTRTKKPVVWIEYTGLDPLMCRNDKPADAVVVENPVKVKPTVKSVA